MASYISLKRLGARKRKAIERIRRCPFDLPEELFKKEYRMYKGNVRQLCELLDEDLIPKITGKHILTTEQKVLISLKVLASGSFQNVAKDYVNVAQPTVSKVLEDFVDALNSRVKDFIFMPSGRELNASKQQFYAEANFPGVVGAIDGTHIPIIAPNENEHLYVGRKGYHTINVQVG